LVTPECTRGVIDPLYHSRHNGRDRQYECDRGIIPIRKHSDRSNLCQRDKDLLLTLSK